MGDRTMKRKGILWFLLVTIHILWAQSPPGWVVQGNLQDATWIRDIAQPAWNQNLLLACGEDRFGRAGIWKSNNAGNSWSFVITRGSNGDHFRTLDIDHQNYRIWVAGDLTHGNLDDGLYYSLDEGNNWISVNYPTSIDSIGALQTIAVANSKVYYGGYNDASIQVKFYRYNTTHPNPANWVWEAITTFSNAKGITHFLKTSQYLYIFVRHSNDNASSVYRLNLSSDQLSFVSNINLSWVGATLVKNGVLYAAGDYNGVARVYRSADGITWTKIGEWTNTNANYLHAFTIESFQDTLFVGLSDYSDENYMIYRTSNNGTTWQGCFTPDGVQQIYVLKTINADLWCGTGYNYGDVFKATWNVDTGGVYVFGPTWVYSARTYNGVVYFTTDYDFGEVYKMPNENTATIFKTFNDASQAFDINWLGDTIFVALDGANTVKKSTDNGQNWVNTFAPDGANSVLTLFNYNSTELMIGTEPYGDVFRSNYRYQTGGVYVFGPTWVYQAKQHNGEIYFTTDYDFGEIYKMPNENSATVWQIFPDADDAYDIEWHADTIMVAVNNGSLIKRSSDGGANWQNTFKPDGANAVYSIKYLPGKGLFLGTDPYGDVFKANYQYATGGVLVYGPTWVYQAKSHNGEVYFTTNYDFGEIYKMPNENSATVWQTFNDVSSVYDIEWVVDTVMVAVDGANLIKRSSDGGNTWQNTFHPDGANSVLSMKYLSNKMFIGTEPYGDVFIANYRYQTGGAVINGPTWVYDTQVCGSEWYIATDYHNGEIWKSNDEGQTWTNLTGITQPWNQVYSLIGFGQTLYAGTDYNGDVYVSNDNGQTWQTTGDLSNASDVYSLFLSRETHPAHLFAGTGPNGDVFLSDSTVVTLQSPDIIPEPLYTEGTTNTVYCRANGSDGYRFEVAYDSLFQTVVELSPVVTDTFYTFQNLQDGVIYYYRAYAYSCDLASSPSGRTSSTQDALPPILYAERPYDSSWVNTQQPVISVKYRDTASGIRLSSIQLLVDGSTVSSGVQIMDSMLTYQPPSGLSTGWHAIQVIAQDNFNHQANFEWNFGIDIQPPSSPLPISPPNGTFTNRPEVTFVWNASSDVLSGVRDYTLMYTSDSTFQQGVRSIIVNDTTYTTALTDTIYYWKVLAYDAAGNHIASSVYRFEVDTHAPGVPQPIYPIAGIWLGDSTVTFQWQSVIASSATKPYSDRNAIRGVYFQKRSLPGKHLKQNSPDKLLAAPVQYVIEATSGSTVVVRDTVGNNAYVASLSEGSFLWRIKAIDAAGNASNWSSWENFRVDLTPPTIPQPILPVNNAIFSTRSINFDWHPSTDLLSGVQEYQIFYDENPSFTSPDSFSTPDTSITYSMSMDTTYYWKVRAVDQVGWKSSWSMIRQFTIDTQPPQAPQLTYPIQGTWLNTATVTFQWSEVTKDQLRRKPSQGNRNTSELHTKHSLEFGKNELALFPTPVHYIIRIYRDTTLIGIDTISTNNFTTTLAQDGTYKWQVRAFDDAGNYSSWSILETFGIDTQGPQVLSCVINPDTISTGMVQFTIALHDEGIGLDPNAPPVVQFTPSGGSPIAVTQTNYDTLTGTWMGEGQIMPGVNDGIATVLIRDARDLLGNNMSPNTNYSFLIDQTPPEPFALVAPDSGIWLNNRTPLFIWQNTSDALSGLDHYDLYLNDLLNVGGIPPNDTTTQPASALVDGLYTWQVRASDVTGNIGFSPTWVVKIDSTPPAVTITSPQDGDTLELGLIIIQGTARDTTGSFQGIGVDSVFVSTDNGITWNGAISDSAQFARWSFPWQIPAKGSYTIKVYGRDLLGTEGLPGIGIHVIVPNSLPTVISPIPDVTMTEDADSTQIAGNLNLVFRDVDGDTLTYTVSSSDSNLSVWLAGDTTVWVLPAPNYYGQADIYVTANDGDGGQVTDTVLITVTPINDPPVIVNLPDSLVFSNDSTVELNMSLYVEDIDTPDSLLFWIFQAGNDSLRILYNDTTQTLILSAPGFTGQTMLYCRVVDDSAAFDEDSIWVQVTYPMGTDQLTDLGIPKMFELHQNYPNPFNPVTTIRYGVPKTSHVRIDLFNILGQRVMTLVDERKYPGYYFVRLHSDNLSSGIYFYRMKTDEFVKVRKLMLIR
ncbi:MAG: T9SS C-terminal target domain-containing protein [Methanobacteriota archaeon]|nr:MAG: T9SS C-terminal target domain-containing protein [Euryarchaeota archaeon]